MPTLVEIRQAMADMPDEPAPEDVNDFLWEGIRSSAMRKVKAANLTNDELRSIGFCRTEFEEMGV